MYKISVIIPVYNAENTIERAINSVINQTIGFDNIELILVDDNSSDNSKKIIKKYSDSYPNIVSFFSKENHGYPGFGRNFGIENSNSKFIMFMDNDDKYDCNICKILYDNLIKYNADIVCCDFKDIDMETNYIYRGNKNYPNNYEIIEYESDFIYYPNVLIWNKIFKKSIIQENNIKFVEKMDNEDSLFSLEYFLNINSLIDVQNYYGYIHYISGNNLSLPSFKYTIGVLKSYYVINSLFNQYSMEYNIYEIFKGRINMTLERCVLMNDANFDKIQYVIQELYDFEKYLGISKIKLNMIILTFINILILKKYLYLSSIFIYFLNKLARNNLIKNIYRKLFSKH